MAKHNHPGLGITLLLLFLVGIFFLGFLMGPFNLIGFVIFQGQTEGNTVYIPFDSGLYYKLRDDCSFSITDSVGGTELRNGVNILWYKNETDGLNYSTSNFVHEELYNESNTIFHKTCMIDSCFKINITVSGTDNGGVEETQSLEVLPECADVKLIRYYGGIIGQRPKVIYPFGNEIGITSTRKLTYPYDTILAPVLKETTSLNSVYVLIGTNSTTGNINISRSGYGFISAAYNPAGEFILINSFENTFYYYSSNNSINFSAYYSWFSFNQNFPSRIYTNSNVENISLHGAKQILVDEFDVVQYSPQFCYYSACQGLKMKWNHVQTWTEDEFNMWSNQGANSSMIIKNSNGSNSTFSHWNGLYTTFNMNPAWDLVRMLYYNNNSNNSGYSAFFDDMEDTRRDYEPTIRNENHMSTLDGFMNYAKIYAEQGYHLNTNQWIPRIHTAKYQMQWDYENAETNPYYSSNYTPDNLSTGNMTAIRDATGIGREERLLAISQALSGMNNPPLVTKRSQISYEHYDEYYGIAAAFTKQVKIPSTYTLTTRSTVADVNESYIVARFQMNDHELPSIESFDYFINDSYGSIPFAHFLYITLYQSPVNIKSNAKFFQFDNGPVQTVSNGYITLSGSVGPGHWLKVWKSDLRITSRSGIFFLWGRPAPTGFRVDAVSTDWYPYPDGNTVVSVTYDGDFAAFDEKEKEIVGLDGYISQNIAGQDYKKSYLFFNLTNITLENNITTINSRSGIINTTNKIYLKNQSNTEFTVYSNNSRPINLTVITTLNCSLTLYRIFNGSVQNITDHSCTNNVTTVLLRVLPAGLTTVMIQTPICSESWSCSSWNACLNGTQNRSCTDSNACGTTVYKPDESQSCSCTESWTCDDWHSCVAGSQYRSCSDSNACGTEVNKPSEQQSCTVVGQATSGGGGGSPLFGKMDLLKPKNVSKNNSKNKIPDDVSKEPPSQAWLDEVKKSRSNDSNASQDQKVFSGQELPDSVKELASDQKASAPSVSNLKPGTFGLMGAVILLALASIAFIEKRQVRRTPEQNKKELRDYIVKKMEEAVPRREIKKSLRNVGWNRFLVNHEVRAAIKESKDPGSKEESQPGFADGLKQAGQELESIDKK